MGGEADEAYGYRDTNRNFSTLFAVYDVSKFMDEHPGGDEVLISEGGRDASDAFEDVGHSDDARALLTPMLKGELEGYVSAVERSG